MINSVAQTVKNNLCISCGVCAMVCSKKVITFKFKNGIFSPVINDKCTQCGNCLKICPGVNVDFKVLYSDRKIPDNIFTGNDLGAYIIYSLDEKIRINGTSGGVISNLIYLLLRDKEYDYAAVLEYDKFDGIPAKIKVTNNIVDVLNASKSKYLPAMIDEVIMKIEQEPDKKYIIVGTPCQFYSLFNYCSFKRINLNNILLFGLFCDKTMNYNFLDYLKRKYVNKKDNIIKLYYRSKGQDGWPGDVEIICSEKTYWIDKKYRMELKDYFQVNRCSYCIDKFNQIADISFGDCYIKGEESYEGKSNIIIRSEKGKEILEKYSNHFNIVQIPVDEIYKSQHVHEKMNNLANAYKIKSFQIYKNINNINQNNFVGYNVKLNKVNRLGARYNEFPLYYYLRIHNSQIQKAIIRKAINILKKLLKIVNIG